MPCSCSTELSARYHAVATRVPTPRTPTAPYYSNHLLSTAGNYYRAHANIRTAYTRAYYQPEFIKVYAKHLTNCTSSLLVILQSFRPYIDPYSNVRRLDLFQYDGAPQNPMWIAYDPPQMLPTQTLNPTSTGTRAAKSTGTGKSKRSMEGGNTREEQLTWGVGKPTPSEKPIGDTIWWMVALGTIISSILYLKS